MGLAILARLPLALMLIDPTVTLDQVAPVHSAIALDDGTEKRIIAMFSEVGVQSPAGDAMLAPFISGALALTAHIIAPVWPAPLFRNKACNASERELGILPKLLTSTQIGLSSLLAILDSSPLNALDFGVRCLVCLRLRQVDQKLLIQLRQFLATVSHSLDFILTLLDLNLGLHLEK